MSSRPWRISGANILDLADLRAIVEAMDLRCTHEVADYIRAEGCGHLLQPAPPDPGRSFVPPSTMPPEGSR